MKVSLTTLRKIIREALADHMRLPRGPNSRDDAEDRDLDEPMTDRENKEDLRRGTRMFQRRVCKLANVG